LLKGRSKVGSWTFFAKKSNTVATRQKIHSACLHLLCQCQLMPAAVCLPVCLAGFLLVLWLADPWPPQVTSQRDLIALRFLLFLSHTYAAVLLLTMPLVAVETALRRVWLCDDGGGGAERQAPECGGALGRDDTDGDTRPLGDVDAEADRGRDKRRWLSHAIGYPCCLSVWMVSGLWVACGGRGVEEPRVAECLRARDSLMACLPSVLPSPVEPFWGVALLAVVLLIFRAMEVSARVRQERHKAGGGDNINNTNNNNNNRKSSRWPHLVPALVRPTSEPCLAGESEPWLAGESEPWLAGESEPWLAGESEPWLAGESEPWLVVEPEPRFVDPEKTSSRWLAPTAAAPWTGQKQQQQQQQKSQRARGPVPLPGSPDHAGQEAEGGPRSGSGPVPRQVVAPSLGVMLTTALVGVLSLCTLPLNLSVNVLLVQAMQTVVEGCVDTCITRWCRHFLCPYFVHK